MIFVFCSEFGLIFATVFTEIEVNLNIRWAFDNFSKAMLSFFHQVELPN